MSGFEDGFFYQCWAGYGVLTWLTYQLVLDF
jgi:hypothetical protein